MHKKAVTNDMSEERNCSKWQFCRIKQHCSKTRHI